MNQRIQSLHQQALRVSSVYKKSEAELLVVLCEMNELKAFRSLGFASMFEYCLKALGLSEACACNLMTVARKSVVVPELKEAVVSGDLSISTARKITPVLTSDNADEWIEKAISLPKRQLEKEVARVNPQSLTIDKAKYISDSRLELKMGLSEKTLEKLRRAQDLISQKSKTAASYEMTLDEVLDFYLQRQDPVEKARRANAQASVPGQKIPTARHIPKPIQHQVHTRDQGQCQHRDSKNMRCPNSRWTEIHHIKPFSQGGQHTIDNLITLCSQHHKLLHHKSSS